MEDRKNMKRIRLKTKDNKLKLDPKTVVVLNDKDLKQVTGGDGSSGPATSRCQIMCGG
jgi:bacteriocin-like protein